MTDSPSIPKGEREQALERELQTLISYCRWTISDESPGYHPTLPSAVARAQSVLLQQQGQER